MANVDKDATITIRLSEESRDKFNQYKREKKMSQEKYLEYLMQLDEKATHQTFGDVISASSTSNEIELPMMKVNKFNEEKEPDIQIYKFKGEYQFGEDVGWCAAYPFQETLQKDFHIDWKMYDINKYAISAPLIVYKVEDRYLIYERIFLGRYGQDRNIIFTDLDVRRLRYVETINSEVIAQYHYLSPYAEYQLRILGAPKIRFEASFYKYY